jgi:membrane protease YdiL (CAAX protease family)
VYQQFVFFFDGQLFLFLPGRIQVRFAQIMGTPSALPVDCAEESSHILSRRERWIDLWFVIGVTLCPVILGSIGFAIHPENLSVFIGTAIQLVTQISTSVVGLTVLFYVLWKRGANLRAFGKPMEGMDILRGIMLWAVVFVAAAIAGAAYSMIYQHIRGHSPSGPDVAAMLANRFQALLMVSLFLNPWFEELIVRGFLMTELTQLTNATVAVLAGTLVQALYHVNQGTSGLVQLVLHPLAETRWKPVNWGHFSVFRSYFIDQQSPSSGKCGNPEGISKACGSGGKPVFGFPPLPSAPSLSRAWLACSNSSGVR